MGARQPIVIAEFRGEMPDLIESQLPVGAFASALDCDLYPFLRPRLSLQSFFSLPLGQVVRRVGFLDTASRYLVLTENKAYRVNADGTLVTDITPSSGFTGSTWWQITQQKDALYFVNGIDYIGKFDGISISYLTVNGAPQGARFIESYQGHLVAADVIAGGERVRNRVRLSDIFNPTVWNAGIAIDIDLDTRSPITGLAETQNTLVVFTTNEIFNLPYVGGSPPVYAQKQWEGVGCVASGSLSVTPDGQVFFLAEDGFYRYTVGSQPQLISPAMSDWLRANFDRSQADRVLSAIIPQRGVYVVVLPTGAGQVVWAYHYKTDAWTRYNITMTALQTLRIPEWTAVVGQNEVVSKWLGTDGVSYDVLFPLSDWNLPSIVKRVDFLELVSSDATGSTVSVTFRRSNVPTNPTVLPTRTAVNQAGKNRVYDHSAIGVYIGFRLQGNVPIERLLLMLEQKGVRVG